MRADPLVTTVAVLATGWLVLDGDTLKLGEERIRLRDIDAAEIHHAQCEAERRLGVLTKLRLEQLLQSGPPEIRRAPPPDQTDRYRRTLAQVFVNGEDVACILIREGYTRPWRGRREDWCIKTDFRKVADAEADCLSTSSIDTR